jgi:hypothetical protein
MHAAFEFQMQEAQDLMEIPCYRCEDYIHIDFKKRGQRIWLRYTWIRK